MYASHQRYGLLLHHSLGSALYQLQYLTEPECRSLVRSKRRTTAEMVGPAHLGLLCSTGHKFQSFCAAWRNRWGVAGGCIQGLHAALCLSRGWTEGAARHPACLVSQAGRQPALF